MAQNLLITTEIHIAFPVLFYHVLSKLSLYYLHSYSLKTEWSMNCEISCLYSKQKKKVNGQKLYQLCLEFHFWYSIRCSYLWL